MFILELIKSINPQKSVKNLIQHPQFYYFQEIEWDKTLTEKQKEYYKSSICEKMIKTITKIQMMNLKPQKDILFISQSLSEDTLEANIIRYNSLDDIEKSFESNIDTFQNKLTSPVFMDRNDYLELSLSNVNIEKYSLEEITSLILLTMFSFGIEQKEHDDMIHKHISELTNIKYDTQECYDAEDVFKELSEKYGFEYHQETEEERKVREEEQTKQLIRRFEILKTDVLEIINGLRRENKNGKEKV